MQITNGKSPLSLTSIIRTVHFSNVHNLNDALNLFDEMLQRQSNPPNVFAFTKLLGIITKMRHYDSVIVLYKKMCFSRLQVDQVTMNIVIRCYCHSNLPGFAFSVLGSFFKLGFTPTSRTYNALINGLISADRVPDAVKYI